MKDKLKELLNNCHSPIGGALASSIVIMKDGSEFYGVNVKNTIFRDCIYAEQVAISSAIANGYKKHDFEKIYVHLDKVSLVDFRYLQKEVITEFFEGDKEVVVMNTLGEEKVFRVDELYKDFN